MPITFLRAHLAPYFAGGFGFAALFLLMTLLCLPAVSQAAQAAGAKDATSPNASPLRVALLLENADHDNDRSGKLRAGLARAGKDFGLHGEVLTASDPAAQEALFTQASASFDLVLVADDTFHEILRNNAGNFRKTMFGCIDAGIRAPNIMSVTFADEQAAFLAGAAAAMIAGQPSSTGSSNKKIAGWLSGKDTPAMRSLVNGFTEGARLIDPEMRVINTIVGSFNDAVAGGEAAHKLLAQDACILVAAAGASNTGILDAARTAGVYLMGLDSDYTTALPGRGLMTITRDAERAVYDITAAAAGKAFRGKEIIIYDLANKGVDVTGLMTFKRNAEAHALTDLERRLKELRHEITSGSVRIKSLRDRTLCDCL